MKRPLMICRDTTGVWYYSVPGTSDAIILTYTAGSGVCALYPLLLYTLIPKYTTRPCTNTS